MRKGIGLALVRRYYLSAICFVAPIFFGFLTLDFLTQWSLGIDLNQVHWAPTILVAKAQGGDPKPADTAKPKSGSAEAKDEQPAEDLTIRPLVRQIVGRLNFAASWGVLLVTCAAVIAIAARILWDRAPLGLVGSGPGLALICAGCAALAFAIDTKSGWQTEPVRRIFLFDIRAAADQTEPYLSAGSLAMSASAPSMPKPHFSSAGLETGAHVNTLLGLFAVALMLSALAVLSILPRAPPHLAKLREDSYHLRLLLYSASALFVITLISNKLYVDLAPQLVEPPTDKAVRQVLDAQLLVWSTTFTIILITAFAPAFVAFYTRRETLRHAPPEQKKKLMEPGADAADKALEIVPMSTLASILSVLAPLAASPAFDALQKVLGAVAGGK